MIKALSLITISIVFLVFSTNLNALMAGNESEGAYLPPPPAPNGTASIRSITLRLLIADGGSRFFKSAGHINHFFSLVESSEVTGPDYKGLQKTLDAAIFYLEQARFTYLQLKNQAAGTPYNQEVISRLLNFDYDSCQQENGIFPDISTVWGVNQKYSEFKLFGQYVARVFYSIK